MSATKTISLIGEVSSGKSSFLNCFAGGIVSCVSLQRETFQPLWYRFTKDGSLSTIRTISDELSQIHRENKEKRDKLAKTLDELIEEDDDAESEMSVLKKVCNENKKLPIVHDMDEYNIIDFPGLNDSEDVKNNFFKVFKNRISDTEIVVYVTDSNRAFVSSSEVKQFKKIQRVIQEEQENNYHYVDLVIIVNKFDNVNDEDLAQICGRISSQTGITQDKIFRISSHKLLINSLTTQKMDLYVPEFMKKSEMVKILQNANVVVKSVSEKLKTQGIIHYADIQFDNAIDELGDYKLVGDWDDLLGYLKNFTFHYRQNQCSMMKAKLDSWIFKCSKKYDGTYYGDLDNQKNRKDENILIGDMMRCHKILMKCNLDTKDILQKAVEKLVTTIIKSYTEDDLLRFVLLENIFQYSSDEGTKDYIIDVVKTNNVFTIETRMIIFYHIIMSGYHLDELMTDNIWFKKIFAHRFVYGGFDFWHRSIEDKKWYKGFNIQEGEYQHRSWFINNLINYEATPPDLKQLLIISILPVQYLSIFFAKGMIPHRLLSLVDKTLPIKFEYLLNDPEYDDTEPTFSSYLFASNNGADIFYKEYQKFSALVESTVPLKSSASVGPSLKYFDEIDPVTGLFKHKIQAASPMEAAKIRFNRVFQLCGAYNKTILVNPTEICFRESISDSKILDHRFIITQSGQESFIIKDCATSEISTFSVEKNPDETI